MPRPVAETRLDTRAVRAKLKPQPKPYWRSIETGLHIGSRREAGLGWCAGEPTPATTKHKPSVDLTMNTALAVMNGVPLMVVADNLGHADTRMVEKHYGHLTESYKAKLIREKAPTFGIVTNPNVTPFRKPGG